jgi:hypothetical protein
LWEQKLVTGAASFVVVFMAAVSHRLGSPILTAQCFLYRKVDGRYGIFSPRSNRTLSAPQAMKLTIRADEGHHDLRKWGWGWS